MSVATRFLSRYAMIYLQPSPATPSPLHIEVSTHTPHDVGI